MHKVISYRDQVLGIWANQPIHSFLVGCLNPCLQGTSERVVLPQPGFRSQYVRGTNASFPLDFS